MFACLKEYCLNVVAAREERQFRRRTSYGRSTSGRMKTALTTVVRSHADRGVYAGIGHVEITGELCQNIPRIPGQQPAAGTRGINHSLVRSPARQRFVERDEEVGEIFPLRIELGAVPFESERSIGRLPFVLVEDTVRLAFGEEEVVPEWKVGVGSGRGDGAERRRNPSSRPGWSRTNSDVAIVGDVNARGALAPEAQGERSRERSDVVVVGGNSRHGISDDCKWGSQSDSRLCKGRGRRCCRRTCSCNLHDGGRGRRRAGLCRYQSPDDAPSDESNLQLISSL